MSDNINLEENCCKTAEVYDGDFIPNPTKVSARASVQINDTNENECNKTETVADTKDCASADLLVKLGNDTTVYNISKALERVRYIINSISMQYTSCSPILPHHRCVTYVSEAQKIIKDNQKKNVFKFVSSYPSSGLRNRKYNKSVGIPVIIIGDVTSVQEDQCSYVFICAYINELTAQNVKAANALKLLGADELSDDSSSVDSSDDSSVISSIDISSDEEDGGNKTFNFIIKEREGIKSTTVDVRNPLVFLEDGAADKLPPVRESDVKIPKQDSIEIGYVLHIHELLVTVQGHKDSPALNADTLLFLDHNEDDKSLQSMGFIYEIIGPVDEPVYCITFKEEQNIEKKQIKQGAQVYISPSCEHTHFVFVQDLLKQKGSDASWKNDVEPPEQFIEYSDDEEERQAKQRLKRSSSESSSNTAAKKCSSEDSPKAKRKRQNSTQVNDEVDARNIPSVGLQQHQVPSRPPEVLYNGVHSQGPPSIQYNGLGPHHLTSSGQQMVHRAPGPSGIQYNGIDSRHLATSSQQMAQRPPRPSGIQYNGIDSRHLATSGQQMAQRPPGPSGIHYNGIDSRHLATSSQQMAQRPPGPSGGQYNGINPHHLTISSQQMARRPPGPSGVQYNGINPHHLTIGSQQMAQRPPGPSGVQYEINPHCLTSSGQQMAQRPPGPSGIQYNGINPHHLTSSSQQMAQRPPGPSGIQSNGVNPHHLTSNGQQIPQGPPRPPHFLANVGQESPDVQYNGVGPHHLTRYGQRIPRHLQRSSEAPYNGADSYCSTSSSQQMLQEPPGIQHTETGPQHFTKYGQRIPRQLQGPSALPNIEYNEAGPSQQLPNATQLSGVAVQPPRRQQYRFSRPAATVQEPPRVQPYPRPPLRFLPNIPLQVQFPSSRSPFLSPEQVHNPPQ